MPVLPNAKHERFAQELAKGKSATEAYVSAGYQESRSAASRLSANVNITARVIEIQERGVLRTEVTIESLIREAGEIQQAAMSVNQLSAATAALTAKAKLAGLWVDKAENTNRNVDANRLTDGELAAIVESDSGEGATSSARGSSKPH